MSMSLESHDKRITRLEKKDEHFEERFSRIHSKIDENEKKSDEQTKKIFESLDTIKDGQHSQDLVNQKMDFTLNSINRERELDAEDKKKRIEERKEAERESRRDLKQMKYLSFGMIGTVGTSLIVALVRTWLGF